MSHSMLKHFINVREILHGNVNGFQETPAYIIIINRICVDEQCRIAEVVSQYPYIHIAATALAVSQSVAMLK